MRVRDLVLGLLPMLLATLLVGCRGHLGRSLGTRGEGTPRSPVPGYLPPSKPVDCTDADCSDGDCGRHVGLIGDSITAVPVYPRLLQELCPRSRFTNSPEHYARGGKRSDEMRRDIDKVLQADHDVLVILGGVNNNHEWRRVIDDLGFMYQRVRRAGVKVVAVTLLPCGRMQGWTPRIGRNIRRINEWIRDRDRLEVDAIVDGFRHLGDPRDPDRMRLEFSDDGLHPNEAGYRALVPWVRRGLREALELEP